MWKLMVTPKGGEWVQDGVFATITAAARRINQIEGSKTEGLFLKVHFCTITDDDVKNDFEDLSYMHFDGQDRLYGIKRLVR